MNIEDLKPASDKKTLVFLAGLMWFGVGIGLIFLAVSWLNGYSGPGLPYYYAAGFLAAMLIHHFGFLRIADKNLERLLPLTEKKCIFSFMSWKSYLIVLVMVPLGITLRHSAIPKHYLSVLYNGLGLALFLSSLRYFRFFFKLVRGGHGPAA